MNERTRLLFFDAPPRRQRGLGLTAVVVALLVVVVLVAAGAGGYFYLQHAAIEPVAADERPPPEPTFVEVDPMTVNLAGDARVLYIGLSLRVADDKTATLLHARMPEVRNRMLITLSDQDADDLSSAEGKRAIAKTLRETLRTPYRPQGKPAGIDNVLFTDFIVQ